MSDERAVLPRGRAGEGTELLAGLRVREAVPGDYEAVRRCMDEVFRETAGRKSQGFDRSLWEWQYLRNELPSLIVVAEGEQGLCGYYHALRFRMRFRGRPALGAMIQDVGTLSAYRRQGVFRAMGGFMLERLRAARDVDFIYTFPNARSLPSFVRDHRYGVVARVPVYVAPLDVSALLVSRMHLGAAGRWLGRLLQPLARALGSRRPTLEDTEQLVRLERLDDRLEPVVRAFARSRGTGLQRSSRYLTWRFLEKPKGEYAVWALARGERLCAYVVTRPAALFDTRCTMLMDFACLAGEEAALRRLIRARLEADRREGAVLAVTMGLHPAFGALRRLGFVRVPQRFNPRPFDLLARGLGEIGPELFEPSAWHVTLADWDVF